MAHDLSLISVLYYYRIFFELSYSMFLIVFFLQTDSTHISPKRNTASFCYALSFGLDTLKDSFVLNNSDTNEPRHLL